jgi:hypothetical protein
MNDYRHKILVCGGRNFIDRSIIFETLYDYCDLRGLKTDEDKYGNWLPCVTIIHGGASGADSIADDWAIINWCPVEEFKADWKKYGKAAGPIRNKQMLDEGKPDVVIAFPGGRGTQNMVQLAEERGIETLRYNLEKGRVG